MLMVGNRFRKLIFNIYIEFSLISQINFEKAEFNIISRDEINEKYTRLLRLLANSKFNSMYSMNSDYDDPMVNSAKIQIQYILNDIYTYFTSKITGKTGYFRFGVMGKSIDRAGITVISAPRVKSERYTDMESTFDRVGVPLYEIVMLYYDFIVKGINDWLTTNIYESDNEIMYKGPDGKILKGKFDKSTTSELFSDNQIYKMVKKFEKSKNSRFEPLKFGIVLYNDKGKQEEKITTIYNMITYEIDSKTGEKKKIIRPMTVTDLFYQVAFDVVKDKCLYITRYPVDNNHSIFPVRINLKSTIETVKIGIAPSPHLNSTIDEDFENCRIYEKYPKITIEDIKDPTMVGTKFMDTLSPFNGHLEGIGGDYDGDTMAIRGCFTQEANIEANNFLKSKNNILTLTGSNVRTTKNDAIQTIYSLTK